MQEKSRKSDVCIAHTGDEDGGWRMEGTTRTDPQDIYPETEDTVMIGGNFALKFVLRSVNSIEILVLRGPAGTSLRELPTTQ